MNKQNINDPATTGGRGTVRQDGIDFEECFPPNTSKKTRYDISVLQTWLSQEPRRETRPIETIPPEILDSYLAEFFTKAKKKSGDNYEPDTLSSFQASFGRYLRSVGYSDSSLNVPKSKQALNAKRDQLKEMGFETRRSRGAPFTREELEHLRQIDLLGTRNQECLINSLFLNNLFYFGIRGRSEHHALVWGDIVLKTTRDGLEYLCYTEKVDTKTLQEKKAFAIPEDPEKCPVAIYKCYKERRPPEANHPKARFYLTPLAHTVSKYWFKPTAMGVNKLGELVKTMVYKGGLNRVPILPLMHTADIAKNCNTDVTSGMKDLQNIDLLSVDTSPVLCVQPGTTVITGDQPDSFENYNVEENTGLIMQTEQQITKPKVSSRHATVAEISQESQPSVMAQVLKRQNSAQLPISREPCTRSFPQSIARSTASITANSGMQPFMSPDVNDVSAVSSSQNPAYHVGRSATTRSHTRLHQSKLTLAEPEVNIDSAEENTVEHYLFCLPSKTSRLPHLSSPAEDERRLILRYHKKGYGFPARAFVNGGDVCKSRMVLGHSPDKFYSFITDIYPVLEDKHFDVYKQESDDRLLRVDSACPQVFKDTGYEGALIIVPYEFPEDRPPRVLFVNTSRDQAYLPARHNTSHMAMVTTSSDTVATVPSPSIQIFEELPNTGSPSTRVSSKISLPVIMEATSLAMDEVITMGDLEETVQDNASSHSSPGTPKIPGIVKDKNCSLGEVQVLHVRSDHLVEDVMKFYQENSNAVTCNLRVFRIDESESSDEINPVVLFAEFWRQVLTRWFEGNTEVVPQITLSLVENTFLPLGQILLHGLLIASYWPLRLSRACAVVLFTGNDCSDELLRASLKLSMSETQREVVESLRRSMNSDSEYYSSMNVSRAPAVLETYGCERLPPRTELDSYLLKMSRLHFYCRPFWSLMEMRRGLTTVGRHFNDVTESDVVDAYSALEPNPFSLKDKLVFVFSNSYSESSTEKNVKIFFEKILIRLSKAKLQKMLLLWCGCDCLSVDHLYVKFGDSQEVSRPVFNQRANLLILSRNYVSVEELGSLFEPLLQTSNSFM